MVIIIDEENTVRRWMVGGQSCLKLSLTYYCSPILVAYFRISEL